MKSPRFHSSAAVMGALSLFLLPAARGVAQTTATTDPVGYVQTACLANTDTILSLPFARPALFVGAIGSIASNTITVASNPSWTTDQYVYGSTALNKPSNTYYAIIGPSITALANTVSVTNASPTVTGTGLSSIVAGDELLVNGLAYNVVSVTTDGTSLTLDRNYAGATASGLNVSYDHSPKEGSYYTVTTNGSNTLTVNLNGDSLGTVTPGTTVSVIPYWTLGEAFPGSDAGASFIASTSTSLSARNTQIFLPDLTTADINLAPKTSYYYYNSAWRQVSGNIRTSYNDILLLPSTYFILRNTAAPTTFTPAGGVYMNRETIVLDTNASKQQDNAVAIVRPTDVALNDLGLISSGAFTPSGGTSLGSRTDQLLVYNNSVAGTNKAPTATYYYTAGYWHQVSGNVRTDYGTVVIPAGTGFTIRKAVVSSGVTSFWMNTRNY